MVTTFATHFLTREQLTHSGDIEWYDTLEEWKARAERILHDHQVRVH
jgi:hypothetical protein